MDWKPQTQPQPPRHNTRQPKTKYAHADADPPRDQARGAGGGAAGGGAPGAAGLGRGAVFGPQDGPVGVAFLGGLLVSLWVYMCVYVCQSITPKPGHVEPTQSRAPTPSNRSHPQHHNKTSVVPPLMRILHEAIESGGWHPSRLLIASFNQHDIGIEVRVCIHRTPGSASPCGGG